MGHLLPFSHVPLYGQIKELLREKILDGSYPPHGRMPSESELMVLFGVSRITVRQALGDLQKEGMIFKIPGKGSFVSKPKYFQNVSTLMGLAESMRKMEYEVINQVKSLDFIEADAVAEKLRVPNGSLLCEIKRVRLINREPVSLEVTYVPEEVGRWLEKSDLVSRDIFLILENDCSIPLGHADLSIDAILANEELSRELDVEEGAPIMRIERLTHNAEGQPVDFEYLYYRGDAFQYRLRIERQRSEPS